MKLPIGMPGDVKLLGGEFILGPGLQCTFTHRMTTVRGHLDIDRTLTAAGCDLSLKTPPSVGDEKSIGRRSESRMGRGGDSGSEYESATEDSRSQRAASTKSSNRKKSRFGGFFSRRKSSESDYEDAQEDIPDGRRSSASTHGKKKKEKGWSIFTTGRANRSTTAVNYSAAAPPMPAGAVAAISAAKMTRGDSGMTEPREELETLEQRPNKTAEAISPARAIAMQHRATYNEPNSFKELTAAALRPMPKQKMGGIFGGFGQRISMDRQRSSQDLRRSTDSRRTDTSSRPSQREHYDDSSSIAPSDVTSEYSAPRDLQQGRMPLSDMSRAGSQVLHTDNIPVQSRNNSIASSTFDATLSSMRMNKLHPTPTAEDARIDPARRNKTLPSSPTSTGPIPGGSFLGDLDVVDGFRRGSNAAGGKPAQDSYELVSEEGHMEDSVDDTSDVDAGERFDEPSSVPEDASYTESNYSDEGMTAEDYDEDEQGTLQGHGSSGRSAPAPRHREGDQQIELNDGEAFEDIEDEDDEDRTGGGLNVSSMRPTLSPTPEEDDEEDESDHDAKTPSASPVKARSGRPVSTGSAEVSRGTHLGTFREEEEEDIQESEEERAT